MMQPANTVVCFMCKAFVSYKEGDSSKLNKHMKSEHMAFFGGEYLLAGCSMSEEERLAVRDVIKDRIESDKPKSINPQTTVVASLEDIDTYKEKRIRFNCTLCPISFAKEVNLEEHVKVHKKKGYPSLSKDIGETIKPNNSSDTFLNKVQSFKDANRQLKKEKSSDSDNKENIEFLNKFQSFKDANEQLKKEKSSDSDNKENSENYTRKKRPGPASKTRESIIKSLTVTTPVSKSRKKQKDHKPKLNQSGNCSTTEADPDQEAGDGKECPICQKAFKNNGTMKRHFEDIHKPGEFPCQGCGKVFTSSNKVSSHFSRNCKDKARRSSL